MPTTSLTTAEAGVQITRDNYFWNGTLGQGLSITWAFRATQIGGGPDGVDGTGSGFAQYNAQQMVAAMNSLQAWSDVANITFNRVGTGTSGSGAYADNATILLGGFTSGAADKAAYAYDPVTKDSGVGTALDNEGDVWINDQYQYNLSNTYTSGGQTILGLALGGYGAQVQTHEIGHALGLEHPGDYNAAPGQTITYGNDAEYVEDTRQYSVMSYFSEQNTNADFKGYYGMAPMMDDIAAMQRLYGANTTAFSGDTTYGFNGNTGRAWYSASSGVYTPQIYCVWDTGGTDTLDYSGYSSNQKIDLNSGRGHFSDVGGLVGNVSIYDGVVIENARGGSGADQIFGNGVANVLNGGDGADTLHGGDGADTLVGGNGSDLMSGDAGDDTYFFDGSDTIIDSSGNDTVRVDTSSFGFGSLSVLNGNFAGIENLTAAGSGAIDLTGDGNANSLIGSDGANSILGGGGNDGLIGNGGADTLDAGLGSDTLFGGAGDDLLVFHGGTGAANGGDGTDTLSVDLTGQAVTASGSFISWSGGSLSFSAIETFDIRAASISGFIDGAAADYYFVTTSNQMVTVDGGDGVDVLYANFTGTSQAIRSDLEQQTFRNGERTVGVTYFNIEQFVIDSGSGADFIQTGTGVDTIRTHDGDDILDSQQGVAFVDGGAGLDKWIADLSASSLNGTLNLNAGGTQAFMGGSVAGIEQLQLKTGSGVDAIVTLIGPAIQTNDYVFTGLGNDTITMGGGMDTADGSDGVDTLVMDLHWTSEAIRSDLEFQTFRNGLRNLGVAYFNMDQFNLATGSGNDYLQTGSGSDTVNAGGGDDKIDTLQGYAIVNGGAGADWWLADYTASTSKMVINLAKAGQTFSGGKISSIEQLTLKTGSGADKIDTLVGSAHAYNDYVFTGAGDDRISVGGGHDTVDGSDGNDILEADFSWTSDAISSQLQSGSFRNGSNNIGVDWFNVEQFRITTGSGADYVATGSGRDTVSTGAGDDIIDTGFGVAVVNGGDGADRWMANFSTATADAKLDLDKAGQKFLGGSVKGIESVWLSTGSGDDQIATKVGPTYLFADSVFAGAGDDVITMGAGSDTADGSDGDDTLVVDYSWDSHAVFGSGGQIGDGSGSAVSYFNVEHLDIRGGTAADSLIGGSGDDSLTGSAGADQLTGGTGNDRFIYQKLGDSTTKASDLIIDIQSGDVIDLHQIDADTKTAGNQGFHIAGKFTKHAGELVLSYDAGSDRTSVAGDVNGDGKADFTILLAGDHHDFAGFVL